MRDPSRIYVICNAIAEIWGNLPDWRLGQLFCNLQAKLGNDLFYMEDKELVEALWAYVEELKP